MIKRVIGLVMFAVCALFMFFAAHALAQTVLTPPAPQPGLDDILSAVFALVKSWKAVGTLGAMIATLNIVVMLLKSQFAGDWFGQRTPVIKAAALVVIGQVIGILAMVAQGTSVWTALITGLLTTGGGVSIWELAIKPFLKKGQPSASTATTSGS